MNVEMKEMTTLIILTYPLYRVYSKEFHKIAHVFLKTRLLRFHFEIYSYNLPPQMSFIPANPNYGLLIERCVSNAGEFGTMLK